MEMHKIKKQNMYKMVKFTAETFAKNCVHTINVNKTVNKSVLWIKIIDIQKMFYVKNVHDLAEKENKSKFNTSNPLD